MCSSLRRLDLTYVIQTHRIRKKKRCESDDVLLVELLIVCPAIGGAEAAPLSTKVARRLSGL